MAGTNATIMLDFNTILKDWKHFQHSKLQLKMANSFPCSFNAENFTWHVARVSFITEPGEDRCLEFSHASGTSVTLYLADLRGYNVGATNIQLLIRPERMLGSPSLEFNSQAVQALVLEQLQNFTREMVVEGT